VTTRCGTRGSRTEPGHLCAPGRRHRCSSCNSSSTAGERRALRAHRGRFALIYNGTRIFHIAHGAVFTFGGYALYLFAVRSPAVDRGAARRHPRYRRFRRADGCTGLPSAAQARHGAGGMFIASIGALTCAQAVYALVFGTDT